MEYTKSSSKKIDDDENIRVLVVKDKKIAIITLSAKPVVGKLLTVSTKVVFVENWQDKSIKKVWI